jgi:cytochrome c oxidase cbb3-type subunit 4
MDINFLRTAITVIAFVLFVCILVWVCLPSKKADFDEAAQLPFKSEEELDK